MRRTQHVGHVPAVHAGTAPALVCSCIPCTMPTRVRACVASSVAVKTALTTKQQCHRVCVLWPCPAPQLNEAVVLFICSMAMMLSYQQVVRVFRLAGSKQVRASGPFGSLGSWLRPGHRAGAICMALQQIRAGRQCSAGHITRLGVRSEQFLLVPCWRTQGFGLSPSSSPMSRGLPPSSLPLCSVFGGPDGCSWSTPRCPSASRGTSSWGGGMRRRTSCSLWRRSCWAPR